MAEKFYVALPTLFELCDILYNLRHNANIFYVINFWASFPDTSATAKEINDVKIRLQCYVSVKRTLICAHFVKPSASELSALNSF